MAWRRFGIGGAPLGRNWRPILRHRRATRHFGFVTSQGYICRTFTRIEGNIDEARFGALRTGCVLGVCFGY